MALSLSFTVRRGEPVLVAPADRTPHEFKRLSDIDDQEGLRFQVPFIQFYPNYGRLSGRDPASVIREALAKALVFYYPFAGRLREGPGRKLAVECTGEGVLFIEADADVSLQQFGEDLQPPFPCFDELLFDVPGSGGVLDCPLLLIQVTRLLCGGFIFALRLNHTMADGTGLVQFMNAVAEMAHGLPAPTTMPVWERKMQREEDSSAAENNEEFEFDSSSKLYDAYNELHGMAQEFSTPFDAPAILVVGHQTDGKSALVEALMGFQFNHVGGGTKTRRPITLHMTYNPSCHLPLCRLLTDSGDPSTAHQMSLAEIQGYIEAENMRLENEPSQFSEKEIIIRIEYKYCPNLTIIDTPGLILPAPGRKNRALQGQARAVETLVRAKMQHKEFIILCLEDCSDWSNATTRRVVMQIDPELSRTVLVSTKLDTKIPQFARSSDVEVFLKPPACILDGCLLGDSPFFTSVPSGRVGAGRDCVYGSNEEFKKVISLRELEDVASLEEKLGRLLSMEEKSRIGVSSLRLFLEELLQKRYMESVPLIIPLLEKEYRSTSRKLREISQEISNLDEVKLKEKGRAFHDSFLTKLSLLLKGTVVAPPDKFGEMLQDERTNGGMFGGTAGHQFPQKMMPNAGMRLYGGAQYHRAMAEFRLVVGSVNCPPISREEIVNACGVEDIHDGTNYSRTACVIAVAKARDTFEPFLHQLGYRLLYILKRLLPISVYLLQKDGDDLSCHELFLRRVEAAFNNFAETTERACRDKCMEDLVSTTRYVTWSLHNKNRAGLRQFLDSFAGTEHSSFSGNSFCPATLQSFGPANNDNKPDSKKTDAKFASGIESNSCGHTTETRLVDILDSTLWNRRLAPSSEKIVYGLVHQIFHGIKEHFLVSTELKFNCFFLMPVVDKLPALLRDDLESAFEDDLDSIFDVTQLRSSLGQRKRNLEIELKQAQRLREKFREIHEKLSSHSVQPKKFSALTMYP